MANSMLDSVNAFTPKGLASEPQFKMMTADLLCASLEDSHRKECLSKLQKINVDSSDRTERNIFFMNNPIGQNNADFEGHGATITCAIPPDSKDQEEICKIDAPVNRSADTLFREYQAYLKGFQKITNSNK